MNIQPHYPVVVPESAASARVLKHFGIPAETFFEVARAMRAARNSCTANDVLGAPGFKAWMDGSRRLRELAAPLGWNINNDDHLATIYSPLRNLKIAVMNTDENTGIENAIPQSRSRKGPMTEKAISHNGPNQAKFEELLEEAKFASADDSMNAPFWYLCVFSEQEVLRAELACPAGFNEGFFTDFHERIILIGADGEGDVPVIESDYDKGPDFEIAITRKAG